MPSNTTRIAKNTLMLYFRQILIMLVSLYTVRVVLNTLGAEDYGIYNVVAGVVVLFSFLNNAMVKTTQRFLNFAMGQENTEQARNIYSISFVIHIMIALLVIILAETAGLWFFYNWLNIPLERKSAAFIVYQFSVVTTVISILQVPYYATVIAYEKMSFFAITSIIECILKLAVVFLLSVILFDSLILYAFLVTIFVLIIFFIYKFYCNKMFEIARFRLCKDMKLFRQFAEFSGWNIFTGFADMSKTQGINVLLNIFHGVTVNAALGIAMQVNAAVYQFVNNFQIAFNPQIVKSYAIKDYDYFIRLIFQTSKISFYLLLFFVLPLYINMDFVLHIWLKNVPEYTVVFTRLILLFSLINALSGPLWMSVQAIGDIKKYQIIVGCITFAALPLSFLLLWIGFSPVWVLIAKVGTNVLNLVYRILFLGKKISLSVKSFLREVIVPILVVTGISASITVFSHSFFIDWSGLIISCIVSVLCIGLLVYFIGLNLQERMLLQNWIKTRILKK